MLRFRPPRPDFHRKGGTLPFSPMACRAFSDSGSIADHRVRVGAAPPVPRSATRMSRTREMITPARCERYDAIDLGGDVLVRRTTKVTRAPALVELRHTTVPEGTRCQDATAPAPRHRPPATTDPPCVTV